MVVLVLGGTRSGKSEVAERLVARCGDQVTYVAPCASPGDDPDLTDRIARHRARRPRTWTTVECGGELPGALRAATGPVLVDSLGTWVAGAPELRVDVQGLVDALAARVDPTVLVSEEVGLSIHPSTPVGREFVDRLGELNAAVAAVADDVLLVVAGRVLSLPSADRFFERA